MQTLHLTGINKLLHPERDKRSATERIFDHLSHSNLGLNRGEATADTGSAASALDSFSVTQNISELLSPACGMSEEEKKAYLAKIIAKLKSGKKLTLTLGYSHPVEMEDPEGIETVVEGTNKITVKGIDKERVGQFAAEIRTKRPPEPYKGKGIKYADEHIRRKVGKTGKK